MKATSRGERMGRVQPFGRPYGAPCGLDAPHALWERQTRHENEDISGDFQTPDHNINRPEIGPMIGDHFIVQGSVGRCWSLTPHSNDAINFKCERP